jgi:hypothetical protein
MEADLSGPRRPAPSTWGPPLGLGPFPEGPAKVPGKVPPPRATALQCFSSLPGTLGPDFRGKERNKVKVRCRVQEGMKKEGNVPRWSQGPKRLTHDPKPMQCNEFQRWYLAGTSLGPLLSRGQRSRLRLDAPPSIKTCCPAPHPLRMASLCACAPALGAIALRSEGRLTTSGAWLRPWRGRGVLIHTRIGSALAGAALVEALMVAGRG